MTTNFDSHLNDSDLDLLSAYIDRQLSAEERAALERRLDREPALRGQLDELSATVALLRDLEPARPPRSFALDPAAVAPRRAWSFPWRGLGSAVVALFLLVAFGAALLRVGGGAAPASAPSALRQNQESAAAPTPAPEVSAAGGAAGGAPAPGAAATSAPAAPPVPMVAQAEQPSAASAAEPPAIAAAKEPTPAPAAQQPEGASAPEQATAAPDSTSAFGAAAGAAGESSSAATATPQLAAAQPAPQAAQPLPTEAAVAAADAQTNSAAGGSANAAPTVAGYTAQAVPSTSAAEQPPDPSGQEGVSGSRFGLIVGAISLGLLALIVVLAVRQRRRR